MAKTSFSRALAETLRFEGGFVNHSADPGGATNLGITRAVLADWRGKPVSVADVRTLALDEAAAIYRRRYWEMVNCDNLPAGIDLAVFDYAVNSGVARASRAIQKVLGVTVDGIVGRDTVAAARNVNAEAVVRALCNERRGFLRRLRIFSTFGRGWLRRIAAIEAAAIALHCASPPTYALSIMTPTQELQTMNFSKSVVESRTVWANIVGFAALAVSVVGYDPSVIDQTLVVDNILKIIAGLGFVASTLFRIKATKKLG